MATDRPATRSGLTRLAAPLVGLAVVAALGAAAAARFCQDGVGEAEAARVVELLAIGTGATVGDVGAGDGEWTVELAERVGATGRVYATEVDSGGVASIRARVGEAGLSHVTVIEGSHDDTELPPGCCDAILLRLVYHHFTDPGAMQASLLRSLKPGGRLAVIDFEPRGSRPDGVPESREGHGVRRPVVVEEMTAAGFELVETVESWTGGSNRYCLLFRRPAG